MSTFLGTGQFSYQANESSPFHDGQPHLTFESWNTLSPTNVDLKCRITSGDDLIRLGMAVDIINQRRGNAIDLKVFYLWGRMDRRLSSSEPYTLKVLCDFINSLYVDSVSVFSPHSQATKDLLDNYVEWPQIEEDTFFDMGIIASMLVSPDFTDFTDVRGVDESLKNLIRNADNLSFVIPDVGASKRLAHSSLLSWYPKATIVQMHKNRDERSGKILGTRIIDGEVRENCVILDDLCDGGASFKFSQFPLRAAGAKNVSLVIPHGVFSQGTRIEGIDYIYTSNSFKEWEPHSGFGVHRYR